MHCGNFSLDLYPSDRDLPFKAKLFTQQMRPYGFLHDPSEPKIVVTHCPDREYLRRLAQRDQTREPMADSKTGESGEALVNRDDRSKRGTSQTTLMVFELKTFREEIVDHVRDFQVYICSQAADVTRLYEAHCLTRTDTFLHRAVDGVEAFNNCVVRRGPYTVDQWDGLRRKFGTNFWARPSRAIGLFTGFDGLKLQYVLDTHLNEHGRLPAPDQLDAMKVCLKFFYATVLEDQTVEPCSKHLRASVQEWMTLTNSEDWLHFWQEADDLCPTRQK